MTRKKFFKGFKRNQELKKAEAKKVATDTIVNDAVDTGAVDTGVVDNIEIPIPIPRMAADADYQIIIEHDILDSRFRVKADLIKSVNLLSKKFYI